jgi:hypothetical protein
MRIIIAVLTASAAFGRLGVASGEVEGGAAVTA